MATFQKLTDNWNSLSNAEKIALFQSVKYEASIEDLKKLGKPFKILIYNEEDDILEGSITATPPPQLVVQTVLINTSGYTTINTVKINSLISGNSTIRIVATTDRVNYYAYNADNGEWTTVNLTINDVLENGMEQTQTSSVPPDAWDKLTEKNKKLGFAIAFSPILVEEDCAVTDITLNIKPKGAWMSQVKGTVYDYSYVNDETLRMKLYKNGTYRINYNPGYDK